MSKLKYTAYGVLATVVAIGIWACSSAKSNSGGGSSSTSRAINANLTEVGTVTVTGGSCTKTVRDTSSCKAAREALGLSGDWLSFSCNVVLGLANSSMASVTDYSSATYVTVTATGLPDHKSNFYATSGSYSFTANGYTVAGTYAAMNRSYTPSFPNPFSITQKSYVFYIPINPVATTHATMGMGPVGVSVDGVPIYNNLAANTDNIFAEAYSFDECQGHPATGGTFHYHSEPYAISYQDSNLIGVLRDGFFVYGRYDYGGSTDLNNSNTASVEYEFGGHEGPSPTTNTGNRFHYHANPVRGCYHRNTSGSTIYSDDGNVTVDGSNPCTSGSGTNTLVYFLTGMGNGGTFATLPTPTDAATMVNNTVAQRRYWGSAAGTCTGC